MPKVHDGTDRQSLMPYDIVVSIINYRTGDLTIQCVQSVLADLGYINGLVVVVDNWSGDGSADQIADWIASQPADTPVRLVRSPTNSGFSGGHNQGMAAAPADYYLILNSDAVLRPGFLQTILATATAHPRCGFIAPLIAYNDGETQNSCFRFHSPLSELIRAARAGPVTRMFQRHDVALGPDPEPAEIRWASFACIVVNGQMVQEIGPMDEGYFLYFEDIDYCLRGYRAGWEIRQERNATAVHFRGGSGPVKTLYAQRARLPRYYYSSRTRYFYKAHGLWGLIAANLLWYLGRLIKHLYVFTGRPVGRMTRAEWRDIWVNIARPMGPRFAPGDPE